MLRRKMYISNGSSNDRHQSAFKVRYLPWTLTYLLTLAARVAFGVIAPPPVVEVRLEFLTNDQFLPKSFGLFFIGPW